MLLKLKDKKLISEALTVLDEPVDLADFAGAAKVLRVPNEADLSALDVSLEGVETILLSFPAYKDGRAFTQARLLRERFGFEGDIRATGEVLRDQALYMLRCGFTSFEVSAPQDIAGFEAAFEEYEYFYQPAYEKSVPVWVLRAERDNNTRLSA